MLSAQTATSTGKSTGAPAEVRPDALPPHVAALLDPAAYPHPAEDIRLIETHISWVVLAGRFAYKVKKPVNFGFLDFSTIDQRAFDCAEEVRLNRRLCPDLYLGVVDLVERNAGYFIGGAGRAVEPAVRMRRLPASGMLPSLLTHEAVDAPLARRIARRLARFHAGAATGTGVDEYGGPATVRANWRESFAQMAPFVGRLLPTGLQAEIVGYVERFLAARWELFERRVAEGRVREGHGDLHAGSICLEGRRLHLFDCLEFTPRFRCADVASEVAFLAMDFDHFGRADLAAAFVDAYVQASGDVELLRLLDFYRCYRAYVRGKVSSLRLAEPALAPEDQAAATAEAQAYFDLAWAYAGGLAGPTLVVTMGLPASGKSTLARALAGRLGLVHLTSDRVRKELAGRRPTEQAGEAFGRGIYEPAMSDRTYTLLRRRAARWLGSGRSVLLDATYGRTDERRAVRRLAARLGVRLVVLACRADEPTIQARLAARANDPTVISEARPELWPALRAAFDEPTGDEGVVVVDTNGAPGEAAERALAVLRGSIGNTP